MKGLLTVFSRYVLKSTIDFVIQFTSDTLQLSTKIFEHNTFHAIEGESFAELVSQNEPYCVRVIVLATHRFLQIKYNGTNNSVSYCHLHYSLGLRKPM